ncbi:MAG: HAMP domain-containing sensor histidine kinase [Cyclobacteriaceae bacterium]
MDPNTEIISTKNNQLEKRLFEYICLIQFAIMLYVLLQGLYKVGYTILAPVDFAISMIGLLFFYLSRFKGLFKPLRFPLLGILFLSVTFFWFQLGGFFGPGDIGAVVVGISAIILAPHKRRLTFFLFSIFFILALIYIQLKTDWIVNLEALRPNTHINYFLFAFAALLIIYYLKREFDRERRQSERQNVRLKSLNTLLQKTLEDKEAIIDKLNSTRDRLIDAEKMATIGRFTAGIAHELNNPLNFVGGSVWPIQQNLNEIFNALPADQKEAQSENIKEVEDLLGNIELGTQQARKVMEGLIQISPKSVSARPEKFNLSKLLKNLTKFFQTSSPKVVFHQEIMDNIWVHGFVVEINQVLVNLIKNSVEATLEATKPEIKIALSQQNDFAEIVISDNGEGVAEKDQPHIFEPFFTTKPLGIGIGVGLYVSFTIANKHGGDLAYNPDGEGAIFIFKLPIDVDLASKTLY